MVTAATLNKGLEDGDTRRDASEEATKARIDMAGDCEQRGNRWWNDAVLRMALGDIRTERALRAGAAVAALSVLLEYVPGSSVMQVVLVHVCMSYFPVGSPLLLRLSLELAILCAPVEVPPLP